MIYSGIFASPLGKLQALCTDTAVFHLNFLESEEDIITVKHPNAKPNNPNHPLLKKTKQWLNNYFANKFNDLILPPLTFLNFDATLSQFVQVSTFYQTVWQALSKIPLEKTVAYSDLATSINRPKANRAVGLAISKNPIVLMVPCHRVIGKSGKLTGFRDGLWRKQRLLDHEKKQYNSKS